RRGTPSGPAPPPTPPNASSVTTGPWPSTPAWAAPTRPSSWASVIATSCGPAAAGRPVTATPAGGCASWTCGSARATWPSDPYPPAEEYLRRAVADLPGVDPLPTAQKIGALAALARCAEKRGNRDQAGPHWKRVEEFARDQLERPNRELTPMQRVEYVWRLADS